MKTLELMLFLERFSLEQRIYFVTRSVYNKDEVWEVFLCSGQRKSDKAKWCVRRRREPYKAPSIFLTAREALDVIYSQKVDATVFHASMMVKIATKITYMNLLQKEVKKLLGQEFIDESIAAGEELANSLTEMVNSLSKPNTAKLSLVNNQEDQDV